MRGWLKEARLQKELSQQNVADKVNITQQYYNFIENGVRSPSPKVAQKIGETLNFPWTKFFQEQDK